jgi:lysophospholipase L1-like esterase
VTRIVVRVVVALLAVTMLVATPSAAAPAPSVWCSDLAGGSPVIDILGDSLSTGDIVPEVSHRWHALLGDSLRGDGAPGTQVWIGGAIDGSATADYLPGAKYSGHVEFVSHHPSLIMMGWGTNDWAGSIPPTQFRAQYQQIINRVRQLSPGSGLVLVHMPWVYASWASSRGDQAPYRDVIKDLAALNGAQYIGVEWLVPGVPGSWLDQYAPDLVHLNANGQGYLYAATRIALLTMCGRG